MPLFIFKCLDCGVEEERFLFNSDCEIFCNKCGSKNLERRFSICNSEVYHDAKTIYNEQILPDVKRIQEEIDNGNEETLADIFGEGK